MEDTEIREKVVKITRDTLQAEDEIKDEMSFKDDLGADSLALVELVMNFEQEFELEISEEKAEKITTVGEAIEHIEKALASKEKAAT